MADRNEPRRLAVVECRTVTGEPDGIHLSVEEWSPRWEEWLTGIALCGRSAEQGALPASASITCAGCEGLRDTYERALAGKPSAEQEELAQLRAGLDLATEFRIPCPEAADPGRPDGKPVLRPEPLIVRRRLDGRGDGWLILNPNLQPGDHLWTGSEWVYRGELHRDVIYKWDRDEAITEAQQLAAAETERYEQWLAEQRADRNTEGAA